MSQGNGNSTALAKRDEGARVAAALQTDDFRKRLSAVLPKSISPDRMVRVVLHQLAANPYLLTLDRQSLYAAILSAAQLGLEPDAVLGHAYLVPFGRKVSLVVGYKGMIHLARNAADLQFIDAQIVYENDYFEEQYGFEPRITHRPAKGDRGAKVKAFAVAGYTNGARYGAVMTMEEIEAVHQKAVASRGGKDSGPWADPQSRPEMEKKTCIRRLAKYLPLAVQKAVAIEDAGDRGELVSVTETGEMVTDRSSLEQSSDATEVQPPPTDALDMFAGGAAPAPDAALPPAATRRRGTRTAASSPAAEPEPIPPPGEPSDGTDYSDIPQ